MKKKIIFSLLASILVLSACKIDEEAEQQKFKDKLIQLEKDGKLPKLDRTDSLLGIDKNNNGVRDDVEKWIEKKFPNQIAETVQMAKTYQQILSINLMNIESLQEHDLKEDRAINCLISIRYDKNNKENSHPLVIFEELRKVTFNTPKRLKNIWNIVKL